MSGRWRSSLCKCFALVTLRHSSYLISLSLARESKSSRSIANMEGDEYGSARSLRGCKVKRPVFMGFLSGMARRLLLIRASFFTSLAPNEYPDSHF